MIAHNHDLSSNGKLDRTLSVEISRGFFLIRKQIISIKIKSNEPSPFFKGITSKASFSEVRKGSEATT